MFKRALAISGIILLSSFTPSLASVSSVAASCGSSCDTAIAAEISTEISAIANNPNLTTEQKDDLLIALMEQIAAVAEAAPADVRAALSAAVSTVGASLSNANSEAVQQVVASIAADVAAGTPQTQTASTIGSLRPTPAGQQSGGVRGSDA